MHPSGNAAPIAAIGIRCYKTITYSQMHQMLSRAIANRTTSTKETLTPLLFSSSNHRKWLLADFVPFKSNRGEKRKKTLTMKTPNDNICFYKIHALTFSLFCHDKNYHNNSSYHFILKEAVSISFWCKDNRGWKVLLSHCRGGLH